MNTFLPLCRGDVSTVVAFVPSRCSCGSLSAVRAFLQGGFQLRQVIPVSFIFSIKMSFILAEGQNPFSQGLLEQQK